MRPTDWAILCFLHSARKSCGTHAPHVSAPGGHGHLQSGLDEFGAHVALHGVADDGSESKVEHVGQVEPALACRDVGDVPARALSGLADAEVPLHQVRQRRGAHVGDRGADLAAPAVLGVESVLGQQPFDALVVVAELRSRSSSVIRGLP